MPGEEWVWKDGGGELGIEGAIRDGVREETEAAEEMELGIPEL